MTEENEQAAESSAPERQEIVLAFFDVLGFSERLHTIGLEAIYSLYEELIDIVVKTAGGRVIISAVPTGGDDGGLVPATGFF